MKVLSLTAIILLLVNNMCYALAPVNPTTITEAILYGQSKATITFDEFVKPWTAYEENAEQLNESTEKACFFTPFLLLAANARESTLSNVKFTVKDSNGILSQYAGYLVFKTTLWEKELVFDNKINAIITQEHTIFKCAQATKSSGQTNDSQEEFGTGKVSPLYSADYYLYFADVDINHLKPIVLSVFTADGREHRFYFDLLRIR